MAALVPCKVHLHLHLDGSVRPSTLWEISRGKPGPWSEWDEARLCETVVAKTSSTLVEVLSIFLDFLVPILRGDDAGIERVAFEMCEDEAKDGARHIEIRYSPHSLADQSLSARQVVLAVNRGIQRARAAFPALSVRTILCCIRQNPEWSEDVVELAHEFQPDGVVGIDLAANEEYAASLHAQAFAKAKEYGLFKTVHSGEGGPASNVMDAITVLHADRIGHGYHIVDDPDIYKYIKDNNVHLECCPTSSIITKSVDTIEAHPIKQFLQDGMNVSINADDPALFGVTLTSEISLLQARAALSDKDVARCMVHAAQASFLPAAEKDILVQEVTAAYKKFF